MKKPCRECPFRKKSAQGWIGSHERVEEIVEYVLADQRFPCHLKVSAKMDAGKDTVEAMLEAHVCVGSAQFLSNRAKLSRNREVADIQRKVGKSDDVFTRVEDIVAHHHGKD